MSALPVEERWRRSEAAAAQWLQGVEAGGEQRVQANALADGLRLDVPARRLFLFEEASGFDAVALMQHHTWWVVGNAAGGDESRRILARNTPLGRLLTYRLTQAREAR